ncbi:MAG: response regulator, partial [Haloglomus sp.]
MALPSEVIRVLHVDDEPDFADMAAAFVGREDDRFDTETATSASEGLDRLSSNDFDCVVSDYDMPGQNGIEFLEAVREEHGDLPFILYTGKGSEEVASDAISAGVTDYLQKESGTGQYPVLANRIRNAVEKSRAQTELADREKRLNLFFEESPMGVVEWDEN